jgi:segregation and condensation protein B
MSDDHDTGGSERDVEAADFADAAPSEVDVETERLREARRAIEAVVMAATEPVEPQLLAQLVELPIASIEALCEQLAADYETQDRGFVLARVAGGYRFQTHPDLAPYVERFVLDGQHVRLSGPALETLAIVAYKQPVSRAQIAAIRGVNVDAVLKTLTQRGYVEEVGTDPGPGNAILYGTTRVFLERLGLDAPTDLPSLGGFIPDASIVEALERGLRLHPEAEVVTEDDADEVGGDEAKADDLDDETAVDVDVDVDLEVVAAPDDASDDATTAVVADAGGSTGAE